MIFTDHTSSITREDQSLLHRGEGDWVVAARADTAGRLRSAHSVSSFVQSLSHHALDRVAAAFVALC